LPTPHLGGEDLREHPGQVRGDGEHIEGAHPGREEGLVGVAHGGIGDQQGLGLAHPAGEALRAELV
jgi:hypothetical protein